MSKQLLKIASLLVSFSRSKGYKAPGGIRYPGGITYYPRNPDHKDPEYQPTKLLRIERIKPLKYNPGWLRDILRTFKIDEENRVTIVKNVPEINAKLWKIKHLIKVTPIVFPYGEPTEEDINYTILRENGQCLVTKKLKINPESIKALDEFHENPKKMDSTTIKNDSRKKWDNPYSGGF